MNNFEKFKQKATIKFGNQFDYSEFKKDVILIAKWEYPYTNLS